RVRKKMWGADPVEFSGAFFHIPGWYSGPKPVQKPHPPIVFGGYVGKTFERVVDHGNGWNPAGVPLEHLKGMIDRMRAAARAKGKRPEDFEVVYRAFWHPTKDEFKKLEDFGVSHVILDLNFGGLKLDTVLKKMAEIKP